MRQRIRAIPPLVASIVVFCAVNLFPLPHRAEASPGNPQPDETTIACSVLETHTDPELGVAAVVFHQKDQRDGPRLGGLLKQDSGVAVEIQTADGAWHRAMVARLKSCFGRGLLLFRSAEAPLKEKDVFQLKFPVN